MTTVSKPGSSPETVASISEWAVSTFGSSGSNLRVLARVNEEMAEALRAATAEKSFADIAEEATDTLIVLCRFAVRIGVTDLNFKEFSGPVSDPHYPRIIAAAVRANARVSALLLTMSSGDHPNTSGILATLWRKLRELINACGFEVHSNASGILTRLWHDLRELIHACGFEVQPLIDAKMAINRRREWKCDGTGHGYHVRDKSVQV